MAMNDEETVALIAGGHTFGKTHGAADADKYVGAEPEGAPIEEQGFGWKNTFGSGKGGDTITSGLEGAWTTTPTKWSNNYFDNLFGFEWELTKSPAGAHQWTPKGGAGAGTVPDAHDPSKRHAPCMLTTDLSLRLDPIYAPISKRFHENPQEFADAFAKAWYKLTHRDMGPVSRYLGPLGAEGTLNLAGPASRRGSCVDRGAGYCCSEGQNSRIRSVHFPTSLDCLGVGVDIPRLRQTWRSKRGAHSPRAAKGLGNQSARRTGKLRTLETIQKEFNSSQSGGKKVSLADLIVLGGCAAVEAAAKKAGHDVKVSFSPGRTDASQEQTDAHSFAPLEPAADGFRNYFGRDTRDRRLSCWWIGRTC